MYDNKRLGFLFVLPFVLGVLLFKLFPFVASLDHLGPLARSTRDLALAYDAMQGYDADDPVCAKRPVEPASPSLEQGISGLRIAVADTHPLARAEFIDVADLRGQRWSVARAISGLWASGRVWTSGPRSRTPPVIGWPNCTWWPPAVA